MDVGFPTTLKGSGVFPVQLDRLSKIFDSKVVLALLRMSDAKVVEGPKKTRIDLDGLIEIRNGTVILALQAIGRAAAIEGLGVNRIEFDGTIVFVYLIQGYAPLGFSPCVSTTQTMSAALPMR
jgi:hypothetical protein